MSIRGFRDYCQYCRRSNIEIKTSEDNKSNKYICKWCSKELNLTNFNEISLEKRFTIELENFLINLSLERERTNPQSRLNNKILYCTGKDPKACKSKLLQELSKIVKNKNIIKLQTSYTTSNVLFYSPQELFILQKRKNIKREWYDYILVGSIEIKELQDILR